MTSSAACAATAASSCAAAGSDRRARRRRAALPLAEGRGIGLANKLRAHGLQDEGLDTIDADQVIGFSRTGATSRIAHEMLDRLGIDRILLLTNNPSKVAALQKAGIHVVGRRAICSEVTAQNQRYLRTRPAVTATGSTIC